MGLTILIIFIVLIVGLIIWFCIKNKKPTPTPTPTPTPEPTPGPQPEPDTGDTPVTGDTPTPPSPDPEPTPEPEPPCISESETHKTGETLSYMASKNRVNIGWYETDKICDGVWSVTGFTNGDNFLTDIKFEGGVISAVVNSTNYGKERSVRCLTHLTAEYGSKDDYFDVKQAGAVDDVFADIINGFKSEADIKEGSVIYDYLQNVYVEARMQYYENKSANKLPKLYKEDNFPNIYNFYGDKSDDASAFKTFVGWIFALILSELKPIRRKYILKIGYEIGGYDKYSNIYGYTFKSDPNVARLVGSAIYSALRATLKPDADKMRAEIGGSKYDKPLAVLGSDSRDKIGDNDFFIDFREFMPTAPGPYAPGYATRPDETYPNEKKDGYKNLDVDNAIHEYIVKNYNLSDKSNSGRTVQSISDEEWCEYHLFGDNKKVDDFEFHPVFGEDTIGRKIEIKDGIVNFINTLKSTASSSRGILQSATVNPKQYGRLRPGCSWTQEAIKNSSTDDKRNVLCDIDIEDNDGCKDSANSVGYYNKDGVWVHTQVEEDKFCETQKNNLYANSYPSGHSSGIWGAAMGMIELMPELTDKIMYAANLFAVNRTIARYHWNSDTINGRVLGSATNAVCHASNDYDVLLNKAKKDI